MGPMSAVLTCRVRSPNMGRIWKTTVRSFEFRVDHGVDECKGSARTQELTMFDEEIHLTISWHVAEIPEEYTYRPPINNRKPITDSVR